MIPERISGDTPPQINFLNMVIPILMHFAVLFRIGVLQAAKAVLHPTKGDVINDVKQLLTVNRRIYCSNFLTLSNQTSRYKIKCIRKMVVF